MHVPGQLSDEPGLADAVDAADRDDAAVPVLRGPPMLAQPRQIGVATDERRGRLDVERRRQIARGRRGFERRVLVEHRAVQTLELWTGLDAGLVDEHAAGVAVDHERLGLAPAAIEREHQVGGEPLTRRMLRRAVAGAR